MNKHFFVIVLLGIATVGVLASAKMLSTTRLFNKSSAAAVDVSIDKTFADKVTAAPVGKKVRAIVRLNDDATDSVRLDNLQNGVKNDLNTLGAKTIQKFKSIPYMAVEIDAASLVLLQQKKGTILSITEDRVLTPQINESRVEMGIPSIEQYPDTNNGQTGKGTFVAVIDSGVDYDHPFLKNKVVTNWGFCAGNCQGSDTETTFEGALTSANISMIGPCEWSAISCYHGTGVSGVISGEGTGSGLFPSEYVGMARNAHIVVFRVASKICIDPNDTSSCNFVSYDSNIAAALDSVYRHRNDYNFAAVNISLGGGAYDNYCDSDPSLASDPVAAAVHQLYLANIPVVTSAGNSGINNKLNFPSCLKEVIPVANRFKSNVHIGSGTGLSLSDGTNRAPFHNHLVVAPGEVVTTSSSPNALAVTGGTSIAAPHIAGVLALMHAQLPNTSIEKKILAMRGTATEIIDNVSSTVTNIYYSVNASNAFFSLLGNMENEPTQSCAAGSGISTTCSVSD